MRCPTHRPRAYTLNLALFEKESLTPLTIYDGPGNPVGPLIEIGSIMLTDLSLEWQLDEMKMPFQLAAHLKKLNLWGSSAGLHEARPGDALLMTLFYEGGVNGR